MSWRGADVLLSVRETVAHGQLALAYQPVMQAGRTDRVAFYEGLARVYDPGGRIIPARDFIAAIEETETGRDLDVQALAIGLQVLAEQPDVRLSINMSARSIGYPDWMRTLKRGLMHDPTVAERLILEITESSAMRVPELVTNFMSRLARQGISFALDDFGAGFTSFRYLRDFQFDLIKIDGQFIRGIAQNPDNQVLTRALSMIAEQFDMFTVAEAVERAEDAAWLITNGIDCLQGYYYAAPTIHPPWEEAADSRSA
ncbi:diguanylate phosphodiesterase [Oceanicola sp. 22II-s10i]|nr:diguanylate phosphodiesterase [Oceanicola sp. 22II-s10i]